jgi:hypothetical protein
MQWKTRHAVQHTTQGNTTHHLELQTHVHIKGTYIVTHCGWGILNN